jgi:hypothetical protein
MRCELPVDGCGSLMIIVVDMDNSAIKKQLLTNYTGKSFFSFLWQGAHRQEDISVLLKGIHKFTRLIIAIVLYIQSNLIRMAVDNRI